MNTVTVTLTKQPELYFEADLITPDQFAGKSVEEIGAIEISEGKIKYPLSAYATLEGAAGATAAETRIVLNGDWTRVKRIGQRMTAGEIVIISSTDMYTGGWMKGDVYVYGTIENPMPGYKYVDDVETEVDGEKAVFAHYIGDLDERHPTSKGQTVFANLYLKK